MNSRTGKRKAAPRAKASRKVAEEGPFGSSAVTDALVRATSALKSAAGQLADWAGPAAELSMGIGKAAIRNPAQRKALERAGALLRDARETAGLTLADLSNAVNVKDKGIFDLVESGKAALPFEIALRAAGVLARNDPVPFAMQLVKNYNPDLWRTLDNLGIGRVTAYAVREREFINILRSRDEARKLTDGEFARVLAFTETAFELALGLVADLKRRPGAASAARSRSRE